jgi:hypothetical protein
MTRASTSKRGEYGKGTPQAGNTKRCSPVPKSSLSRNRLDDGEFALSWDNFIESKAPVGQ